MEIKRVEEEQAWTLLLRVAGAAAILPSLSGGGKRPHVEVVGKSYQTTT